ncbi:hypothetical protein HMPREF0620_0516 [Parascardovia denticolens DSM 10105 = JCM 12538]|uniref:Uncharacterized protein n=1 Tax=Parascardovia denticolens DSM 10105 = JCM 12538 TaxID=864564 RepID=E6K130_PARDN|nr:hypothetical protein HMPREF0620_0516 [Parascardovia denticolens DSM 10105 = JCM 12538]
MKSKNDQDLFQSTLPLRGATQAPILDVPSQRISIHAPLAGSDWRGAFIQVRMSRFQSTLPLRGATGNFTSA